jgi:hypothetical protein
MVAYLKATSLDKLFQIVLYRIKTNIVVIVNRKKQILDHILAQASFIYIYIYINVLTWIQVAKRSFDGETLSNCSSLFIGFFNETL